MAQRRSSRTTDLEAVYREAATTGHATAFLGLARWLSEQPGRGADVEKTYREAADAGIREMLSSWGKWLSAQPGRDAETEAVSGRRLPLVSRWRSSA
jgi:hypothetical protein